MDATHTRDKTMTSKYGTATFTDGTTIDGTRTKRTAWKVERDGFKLAGVSNDDLGAERTIIRKARAAGLSMDEARELYRTVEIIRLPCEDMLDPEFWAK